MLHIAICDDEAIYIEKIAEITGQYLEKLHMEYQISPFSSGTDFLALKEKMADFDIVFMDINMEGTDGIETAIEMRRYAESVFLIFVTAFINYTIEGYKCEAIRYVLKDYDSLPDNIREALDAVLDKKKLGEEKILYEFVDYGAKWVSLSRIIFVENHLHRLTFHLMEGGKEKIYYIYKKLDEVEHDFGAGGLIRIHQSFLVNMQYVDNISRYEAILRDGTVLPVSKQRFGQAREAFIRKEGAI